MSAVLKDRFEIVDNATVKLDFVVGEVDEQIRFAGEYMTKDHTEKLIKAVLKERFRNVSVSKNRFVFFSKRKTWVMTTQCYSAVNLSPR